MPVNRHQLFNELELKLSNDGEIADDFADIGEQVEDHWQGLALITLTSGYATGNYVSSIHRESARGRHAAGTINAAGKKIGGQFTWHTRVVTHAPHAHFIEYGTGPDDAPNYPKPPNAYGHWTDPEGEEHWWWNTPTPVFALAAQTEMDFSGTEAVLPASRKARARIRKKGSGVRSRRF